MVDLNLSRIDCLGKLNQNLDNNNTNINERLTSIWYSIIKTSLLCQNICTINLNLLVTQDDIKEEI